jgi:hypothetical protein
MAVIFDSRFKRSNSSAEGFLITFPSEKLRRMLTKKGKEWLTVPLKLNKQTIKQAP